MERLVVLQKGTKAGAFWCSFKQFVAADVAESALSTLCNLRGQFAFVIFDRTLNRVLAARDAFGGQPLFWYSFSVLVQRTLCLSLS